MNFSEYILKFRRDELFQKLDEHIQNDQGVEEAKVASKHYAEIKEGDREVTKRILKKYNVRYRKIPHTKNRIGC